VIEVQTKPNKLSFTMKRFLEFLKIFLRNGKATIGLLIILMFVVIAVAAPLLTPYDSLGKDPRFEGAIAGKRVAPIWLRYLPSILGGNPDLSENVETVNEPSLPKLWPEGEFNYSMSADANPYITVNFDESVNFPYSVSGFPFENKNGSLAVTFQREKGYLLNESTVYIFKDFYYPYSSIPSRFIGNVELLVNGSISLTEINPWVQWYFIRIDNPHPRDDWIRDLEITASDTEGIYIAASTTINNYFTSESVWNAQGYKNWREWLNGTETLRHHWDNMTWAVSEGSLTNKTYAEIWNSTNPTMYDDTGDVPYYCFRDNLEMCDSNLTETNNNPDISSPQPWINNTVTLFKKLEIPHHTKMWILVKVVITDPDKLYRLDVNTGAAYDENGNRLYVWKVARHISMLSVPVKVRVFFGPVEQQMQDMPTLFPKLSARSLGIDVDEETGESIIARTFSGRSGDDYWILSRYSQGNPVSLINNDNAAYIRTLFLSMPGKYRYCIELTFVDKISSDEDVFTIVHIDDFALAFLGASFGLMGTDQYSRDLFSQMVYGTRISLYLGILVALISVVIGLIVGLAAGYLGGAADQFLMRFNDLLLVLPGLPLMIVLVAVLGARIENLILLLGFLGWCGFARLVRSQVLSLKERPFVEAAKAAGAGTGHIIIKHILPNVMALVYISLATSVPAAITAEASLSWLGFYDPNRMSWGRMLHEVFVAGATKNWWWVIPPGICISLIAVSFILLGYALDEILNPKLRLRR